MLDLAKIGSVFLIMLLLLRLKWNIGYVMFIASVTVFFLYLTPPVIMLKTVLETITDSVTIKLFFSLTFIRIVEIILREKGVLKMMTETSKQLLRGRKAVIVSMPLLIGLLPSLGGAYFSAPMVEESTRDLRMSSDEKAFINYWFRHPWEYILPLYPGILLASALGRTDLRDIILANTPFAAMIIITGFLFSMRNLNERVMTSEVKIDSGKGNEMRSLLYFSPIVIILFLVIVAHVELHYALLMTITGLIIFYRVRVREVLRFLRYGFTRDVIVLILGTMFFKFTMESSGAVGHLNRFFIERGIPLLPVIFLLPFISGLLTGLTIGFVGSTFPLLMSMGGGLSIGQLSFAFASGYAGVLVSPVHLCLVLTREYFRADIGHLYRRIVPATFLIMLSALIEFFILIRV